LRDPVNNQTQIIWYSRQKPKRILLCQNLGAVDFKLVERIYFVLREIIDHEKRKALWSDFVKGIGATAPNFHGLKRLANHYHNKKIGRKTDAKAKRQ